MPHRRIASHVKSLIYQQFIFFYFPLFLGIYPGSGYKAVEKSNLPHGFLFFTAPQLIGLLVDKLKRFVVGIGSIFA